MVSDVTGYSAIFPEVSIDLLTRIFFFKGSSCSFDVKSFYREIESKISYGLVKLIEKEVLFICDFHFINKASIVEIVQLIQLTSKYAKSVNVEWLYEEGDDDSKECGLFIQEQIVSLAVKNCTVSVSVKE